MNISCTVTVVTDIPRPHALGPVQEVGWMGCRGAPWGGPWHRGARCVAARGLASRGVGISSGQEWPGPGTGLRSHVPAWRAAAHFHLFSGPPRTDRSLVSGGWGERQGSARRSRSGVRGPGEVLVALPGARAARATLLSFCGSLSLLHPCPQGGSRRPAHSGPFCKGCSTARGLPLGPQSSLQTRHTGLRPKEQPRALEARTLRPSSIERDA